MEGNHLVRAAWILGICMVVSAAMLGLGLVIGSERTTRSVIEASDRASIRASEAVMKAAANTHIHLEREVHVAPLKIDTPNPMKIGFEPRLPISVHIENSVDHNTGRRAQFELQLGR